MNTYAVAILCVLGLVVGQVLFKVSAAALAQGESCLSIKAASTLLAALSLYGITSVGWVWVLKRVELGRVYPLMALAFVLVPVCSYFFFGERFRMQYFVGVAIIVAGIVITIRA